MDRAEHGLGVREFGMIWAGLGMGCSLPDIVIDVAGHEQWWASAGMGMDWVWHGLGCAWGGPGMSSSALGIGWVGWAYAVLGWDGLGWS